MRAMRQFCCQRRLARSSYFDRCASRRCRVGYLVRERANIAAPVRWAFVVVVDARCQLPFEGRSVGSLLAPTNQATCRRNPVPRAGRPRPQQAASLSGSRICCSARSAQDGGALSAPRADARNPAAVRHALGGPRPGQVAAYCSRDCRDSLSQFTYMSNTLGYSRTNAPISTTSTTRMTTRTASAT